MSTPDPQTVREIARTFLTDPDVSADELDYVVRSYIGYASGAEHQAWRDAVRADADDAEVVTIASWPDEQQPADVVTAEQQQDGAAEDVTAFLDAWEADRGFGNAIRGGNGDIPYLFATDLRAVLAERTALAARVAELTAGQDMCTCNEPRKVCELRTELDRVHAQLNAALAERPEES